MLLLWAMRGARAQDYLQRETTDSPPSCCCRRRATIDRFWELRKRVLTNSYGRTLRPASAAGILIICCRRGPLIQCRYNHQQQRAPVRASARPRGFEILRLGGARISSKKGWYGGSNCRFRRLFE